MDGEPNMNRASRPRAEAVIELLRDDPAFADDYLQAAMEQADQEGGREVLHSVLRRVAEFAATKHTPER